MPVSRRQKAIWIAMLAAFGVTMIIGGLGGLFINWGGDRLLIALSVVTLVALIGAVLLACLPYWRRLDDMAREAHLSSWYWGASFGAGIGLLAAALLGGVRSLLFQGGALVFLFQVGAYVVFWLVWWARRRPRAS